MDKYNLKRCSCYESKLTNTCNCDNIYNSNSKFSNICNLPALMSDGRLFTDYVSHSINEDINKSILSNNADSNQYRLDLQNNAETIMNNELLYYDKFRCSKQNSAEQKNNFYIDYSNFNKSLNKKSNINNIYDVYYNDILLI